MRTAFAACGWILCLSVVITVLTPARSAPPLHLQRWEYMNYYCSEGRSWKENEAEISKLGAEGWEMTGTALNGRIYFKRPVAQ